MSRLSIRSLLAALCLPVCVASCAANGDQLDALHDEVEIFRTRAQLVDLARMDGGLDSLGPDETVSWHFYVPDSYRPDEPAGLLVYISPTSSGRIRADWRSVIKNENLIWVSANRSGNRTRTEKRILLATLAPYVAAERFAIDPERVYLSGFSGGGKAAGIASIHLADLFRGAIFICGAELWSDVGPAQLARAALNRYVFVTGSRDFNRELTQRTYREYDLAGLTRAKLIEIPGMGHSTPDAEHLREAIRFLDLNE